MREPRVELPPDRSLQFRMLVAMLICGLFTAGMLALLVWVSFAVPNGWCVPLFVLLLIFAGRQGTTGPWVPWRRREPTSEDSDRVRLIAEHLAPMADVPVPRVDVVHGEAPLSWTTALRPSRATVHVTTGLLDRLEDRELEAVVAHEIGHLVQHDAIVMTILTAPLAYSMEGLRNMAAGGIRGMLGAATVWLFVGIPASVMTAVERILSRHRELTADRSAALIMGSPSAVAAAILSVERGMGELKKYERRVAIGRDSLLFLPTKRPRFLGALRATHPTVAKRLARLARMEERLQRRV
jgi:heat shock protein HtpX